MSIRTNLPSEDIDLRAIILMLLVVLLWGGNVVATKLALPDMPPFMLAGVRFGLGAIIIGLWGILNSSDLIPKKSEIFPLIILSALFAAQICTFNLGLNLTLAGRASIFMSINPFFVALLAHFIIPNDRLNITKIIGLILAFLGIIIVFRDKVGINGSRILGDAILISSSAIVGFMTIYIKKLAQNINTYKLLFWEMIFSLIPFFGLSLIFEDISQVNMSSNLFLALLYQSIIVAGISFIIWTVLLRSYSASKLSVFVFAMPIFGVGLSVLMLHEAMTMYLIAGAVLVAGGIYIVNSG
ncbi:MAG: DMT family transporter [bacterium]